MRWQLPDLTGPLCRQPRQCILEIGIRITLIHARRLDHAHDRRRPFRFVTKSVSHLGLLELFFCDRAGGHCCCPTELYDPWSLPY